MFLNNCSLLPAVKHLLKMGENSVKLEMCELFLVLAGLKGEIQVAMCPFCSLVLGQALINNQIIPLIIELVGSDEYIRFKLVKVLKYVTRGTTLQIRYLVECGIISALCKSLAFFKSYDKVKIFTLI